jgi:hypothetical protein
MSDKATSERILWLIVLVWAGLAIVLGQRGAFTTTPDQPPLALLAAVAVPPLLFGVAYLSSAAVRSCALSIDLRLLTALQAWRVVGASFLVLMSFGLLPGVFAWPAGVGDALVGLYAPFVVLAIVREAPGWRRHVLLLNVLGLLDFVGAIGSGVLAGDSPVGLLRGEVTPTFGVPFWIVVHIISLLQLRRASAAAAAAAAAGTLRPAH